MNATEISRTLGLAAMVASFCPVAMADDTGWYGGLNIGRALSKIDDARIINGLLTGGFATTGIVDANRDTGYKLFGGYQFNRNIALEGGYFDLGKFGFTATTVPPGTMQGDIRLRGLNLDVVGTLPITERFSVFGRLGMNYAEARDRFSGTGAVNILNPRFNKREVNPKFGAGVQYDVTPNLAVRLEAERYRINDAVGNRGDVNLISIGMLYRFGDKTPAPVPMAALPQRLAPAPAPAPPPPVIVQAPPPAPPAPLIIYTPPPPPPPAPVPPPRVPAKVTFSAESFFAFDASTVTATGKQRLDQFASDLKGTNYELITVKGHTDRIGSHAYNQALSTRRAEAVRDYLVGSAGIPLAKTSAIGLDGSNPVTKPDACKGNHVTPQLIACLQPDRRVEIEVSGTR